MNQSVNDVGIARSGTWTGLSGLNIAVAVASGAFGVVAIVNPSNLVRTPVASDVATGFFVDMYGLRAVGIAAGLVAAGLTMRRAPTAAAVAFLGGGLVQLGDVAIAARSRTPGVVGASVAAVIHIASAGLLLRHVRRTSP
ncbi:hypothetical protein BJQ94_11220 [Cryobacterium sp. SO2]|uniref:hypothetical protein n=1 Tax=Cryobacterium sp. SO2 TaxID=1897060 RepID=UPI00223D9BA3|nr:hypothetical protein [Cryobacterium sp. SO2]WEO75947.1 hypothetical protein BJQ94_11220 [Cryobacterium sp. SO2]